MKTLENFKLIGVSVLFVAGLGACDKPMTAENAGKNIDRSAEQVGQKIDAGADKAGVAMDDTEITAKVKAAIFAEPGLKTLQISVDTVKGVVTLTGSVNSRANSDTAKSLASAVAGVNKVENKLVVK